MLRKTHFENVPMKPQRVYEEMNQAFGRDTCFVTTIGLSQIAGAQFLHVFKARNWINCGQAGPLGWTIPAALGVRAADPQRPIVALSGDYDFQFMIEELAVGAQFKLPYIHVVVNNSYLGLIRQAQRGFEMDYCVQLAFDNINAPELDGYGVDHVAVAEGLGCKAIRVFKPEDIAPALKQAQALMAEYQRAGRRRDDPRACDEHLDGHRNRRDQRVRRTRWNARKTRRPRSRRSTDRASKHRKQPLTDHQEENMPKFAANLTMLFNEVPFLDRFAAAADAGFEAVEFLFPYPYSISDLQSRLARQQPEARAAQPAGGQLGSRRARHRVPAGSRGRVS